MKSIFPKFIQDELDHIPTREEMDENIRIIQQVFSRCRANTTDAAVKILFLQCAQQELKIQALTDEIESLKKKMTKL
jgi:hypothetical protein